MCRSEPVLEGCMAMPNHRKGQHMNACGRLLVDMLAQQGLLVALDTVQF